MQSTSPPTPVARALRSVITPCEVETIAMPDVVREVVESFVAEHHVEREFVKRKRDRANPEALARRHSKGGHE